MATYVVGSGGGKAGGGSARVAVEAPNTLKSKSYVKIVEVLAEGEIEGLTNGMQSIFLEDTPLQNADGTFNFSDVVVEERTGTLSQSVSKIGGQTAVTDSVGTEVKQATPITYTITSAEADRARVAIRVPALTDQNTSNGDLNGSSVSLKIEYQPNGGSFIQPIVGYSTVALNPNSFTDVTSIQGAVNVTLHSEVVAVQSANGDHTRYVDKYFPSALTFQYNKDNAGWITFYTKTVQRGENTGVPFSLNTVQTSSYAIRVLVDIGSVSFSFLNGSKPSGEIIITGKTTSPYERDVEFELMGTAPWIIKVTRLTADSGSSSLQNKTYLSSVTTIFNEKFRYPGTAYVAISLDAEQFSSIPSRAYDVKLLKIKVPSNYDPIARTYTGVWDGTFQVKWSDNPAWCFYDLLTSARYGLGERIDVAQIDKWTLYDIAQYCDELVDDGEGNLSPRFTCNVLIQSREEAYKVLQDMASVFAGLSYWGATEGGFSGIISVQDKPQPTADFVFNNSNVQDGVFSYSTANKNTQYNVAYVTYNEPTQKYEQAVVYVPDNQRILDDGFVRDTNIVAFGCTSKAQAIRLGRRMLFANYYENEIVNFTVGADGAIPQIGGVIKVSDSLRTGERRGGRVVEYIDSTHLKLDAAFEFIFGITYSISVIDFSGNVHESVLVNPATTTDTIELVTALSNMAKNSAFIISDSGLESELFKVVSVSETEQHVYQITGTKYNASKYGYVDDLINITVPDTSNADLNGQATDLSVKEILYETGTTVETRLTLSWKPPLFASGYIVKYSNGLNENVVTVETNHPSIDINSAKETIYTFSIICKNILGQLSQPTTFIYEVIGKSAPPATIQNFSARALGTSALLQWDLSEDLDVRVGGRVELRFTPIMDTPKWENGFKIVDVAGNQTQAVAPLMRGTYMAKAVDSAGNYSFTAAFASSEFAEIEKLNVVEQFQEHPTFSGTKVNLVVQDSTLALGSNTNIDSVLDPLDTWIFFDTPTGVETSGTYFFSNVLDLVQKFTVRVSATLNFRVEDLANYIDGRYANIDTWISFDGDVVNDYSLKLFVATTDDDPLGTPVWSDWSEFTVADYTARAMKFKLEFAVGQPRFNIFVTELAISADVPDRVAGEENISCPTSGVSINFTPPFAKTPAIAINIDGMQTGDYYTITSKSNSGFTITVYDSTNTAVARQIDWIAKGYGYLQ